jgi:hypothetical protein
MEEQKKRGTHRTCGCHDSLGVSGFRGAAGGRSLRFQESLERAEVEEHWHRFPIRALELGEEAEHWLRYQLPVRFRSLRQKSTQPRLSRCETCGREGWLTLLCLLVWFVDGIGLLWGLKVLEVKKFNEFIRFVKLLMARVSAMNHKLLYDKGLWARWQFVR